LVGRFNPVYTVRGLTDGPHASDSGDEEEPAAHAAADSVPGSSDDARPEPRAVLGHAHAAPARPPPSHAFAAGQLDRQRSPTSLALPLSLSAAEHL